MGKRHRNCVTGKGPRQPTHRMRHTAGPCSRGVRLSDHIHTHTHTYSLYVLEMKRRVKWKRYSGEGIIECTAFDFWLWNDISAFFM